jgi:hypothetical protein
LTLLRRDYPRNDTNCVTVKPVPKSYVLRFVQEFSGEVEKTEVQKNPSPKPKNTKNKHDLTDNASKLL